MLLLEIIIATIAVSFISFIGIFFIFRKIQIEKKSLRLLISLSAGSLLAVSFLDLLPEALEVSESPQFIFITLLVSFLIFFILEKYWHWHHCRCIDCGPNDPRMKRNIIATNLIGDGIHNLTDGFLIAAAFMLNFQTGVIASIVVILHEIPQEISDFGILLYAGLSKGKAFLYNFLFALTAIFGGIIFYFFGSQFKIIIPFMAAFAAGNFIYLAASDLIPELHHEKDPRHVLQHTFWLLAGVVLIFLLTSFLPHTS